LDLNKNDLILSEFNMSKESLLQSASHLKPPSSEAQQAYEKHRETLSTDITNRLSNRSDINELVGENGMDMMIDNHRKYARFMSHLFKGYSAEVFIDTLLWVLRTYKQHGFHDAYWPAQLNGWLTALEQTLPEIYFKQISPFYEWLIVNMGLLKNYEQDNRDKVELLS